jgi:hypothetical protein
MEQFVQDNFTLLFVISIVTAVIVIIASIVFRTINGKNYPVIPEQDITFTERWVSGSSQKNLLTKLGGASNCLSVTLSRNALVIRPMFPFNLMFLPEVYDLEHVVARSDIQRIEPNANSGSGSVVVEFESDGQKKRIDLKLRRRDEFLRAAKM